MGLNIQYLVYLPTCVVDSTQVSVGTEYRGIQTSSIRWIKPNMKNQIKKRLFFLFGSFAMKKEFRS